VYKYNEWKAIKPEIHHPEATFSVDGSNKTVSKRYCSKK
jgi:hypothetical protein